LLSYLRGYKEGGIGKLKELTFNRPSEELKQHQESLEIYFREHPQKTLAHAATIAELTELSVVGNKCAISEIDGNELSSSGLIPAKSRPRGTRGIS
jgi:hypothetical protein